MTTSALQDAAIHADWRGTYHSGENERFYSYSIDRLASVLLPGRILDAGCGSGEHAANFARRGFRITGVDFSAHALAQAKRNTASYADKITLQRGDVTALPFADGEFENVLCWGVLMHIPNNGRALLELTRVTASGGSLVISESNMHSVHVTVKNLLRRLLGKYKATRTLYGLETKIVTDEGEFVTQQADIMALINRVESLGFTLEHRFPGEITDLYVSIGSSLLRGAIHKLNWLCRSAPPQLALGNFLVFKKH